MKCTRKERAVITTRANNRCEYCSKYLNDDEMHVHHIKTRGSGGDNTPSNLITLCGNCHDKAHRALISKDDLRAKIGQYTIEYGVGI